MVWSIFRGAQRRVRLLLHAGVQASYNRNTGTTSGAEANRKANEAAEEASDKLQSYADDIQVGFKPCAAIIGL